MNREDRKAIVKLEEGLWRFLDNLRDELKAKPPNVKAALDMIRGYEFAAGRHFGHWDADYRWHWHDYDEGGKAK